MLAHINPLRDVRQAGRRSGLRLIRRMSDWRFARYALPYFIVTLPNDTPYLSLRGVLPGDDEAIQMDRHGTPRAPRDDMMARDRAPFLPARQPVLARVRNRTRLPTPVKLIDISRPIYTGMPVWPGDSPVDFSLTAMKAKGSDANVGRLSLCVHAGTHADAVFHYAETGARIDEIPLDVFVGPARVVDVRGHSLITTELLAAYDFKEFRGFCSAVTRGPIRRYFRPSGRCSPLTCPAWLAARGVRLVGLDVPSVDKLTSTGMPIHHIIERAGLFILESLDLHEVPAGVYELIALPLRIRGADGSPIRAVLRAG